MAGAPAPEPLVAADVDLRGMPFMPVDIVRLFDSDLYALSSGEQFKAAFTLWGKSFLQVPAASLPSDDRVLAHLSGAGTRWPKVREVALRGWILCSDGRLYHPVVAEKAREAWMARVEQRRRTEAARAARAARRQATTENVTTPVTPPATFSVTENVTGSKGQGQGQGQGIDPIPIPSLARSASEGPPPIAPDPVVNFQRHFARPGADGEIPDDPRDNSAPARVRRAQRARQERERIAARTFDADP